MCLHKPNEPQIEGFHYKYNYNKNIKNVLKILQVSLMFGKNEEDATIWRTIAPSPSSISSLSKQLGKQ